MPWLKRSPANWTASCASAPAMYWTRFQTAQMWGQIAMYDIAQEVIAGPKLAAVQNAAIAACDKNDGVEDGIIDDPRTCTFNAKANVCGQPGAPATCLTPTEANAVNVMWDGPRNDSGKRIWFPIDRGTDFNFWDGNVPFGLAPVQFGWDLANPAYYNAGVFPTSYPGYWGNVALSSTISAPGTVTTYAAVAQAGSNTVADLTDTFDDLDAFKDSRRKNDHLRRRKRRPHHAARRDQLLSGDGCALRSIGLTTMETATIHHRSSSKASRNSTVCSTFPE